MADTLDSEILFLIMDYLRRNADLSPAVSQLESLIAKHELFGCGQRWNGASYTRSYDDLIRKFPLSSSVLRERIVHDRLDPRIPTNWLSLAPPRVFPRDSIFRRIQNREIHQRLRSCPPSLYGRYRHIKTIYGHHGPVFCVAFDRCGKRVITGSDDNRVKIWRTCDGALEHSLLGHTAPISDLAVSICNLFVGSASSDGTVRLWYLRDGSLIRVLELGSEVTRVVFHPQYLICTAMNGSTHALLLSDAALCDALTAPAPTELPLTCEALSVSVSPCMQLFAVGYNHGHIGFFLIDLLGEGFMSPFSDVDISSSGEIVTVAFASRYSEQSTLRIAAGSHTGKFHILSRNSNGLFDIQHVLVDRSPFRSYESSNLVVILAWAANDSKLVTTYHSSIHVWCTDSGNMVFSHQVHSLGSDILSMSVHPLFHEIVFTVSVDGSAIITSLADGAEIVKFPANDTYQLIDCSFSPNGNFICATSDLGRLVLFGTGSRRRHAKLPDAQFFTFENPANRTNESDLPPRVLCDAEFEVFRRQPSHLVQCHFTRDLSEAESDVDSDVSEQPRPPRPPSPMPFPDTMDEINFALQADPTGSRGNDDAVAASSEAEESFSMTSQTDNDEEDDIDDLLSDEDLESFQIDVNIAVDPDQRAPNTRRTRRHDSGSDSDRPLRRWRRSRQPEEAGGNAEDVEVTDRLRSRRRRRQRQRPAVTAASQPAEAPTIIRRHRHRRVERTTSQRTEQSDRSSLNRSRRSDPAANAAAAEAIISRLRVRRSNAGAPIEHDQPSPATPAAAPTQRRMSTRRQNVLNNQLNNPAPASPMRMRTRSAQSSAMISSRITRQSASLYREPVPFPSPPPSVQRPNRMPYSDQPLRARRRREEEVQLYRQQQQQHQPWQQQPPTERQPQIQRSGFTYNTRTQASLAAAAAMPPPTGRTTRRSQQAIADAIAAPTSPVLRRTRPRTESSNRRRRSNSGSSDSDIPLRSARRVRRHVER